MTLTARRAAQRRRRRLIAAAIRDRRERRHVAADNTEAGERSAPAPRAPQATVTAQVTAPSVPATSSPGESAG